ncbi:MAG: hypothetical protein GTO14_14280 [Anaerolineales bacterium]|nr:hypothetical protein [Anaerolineales bacterium]
MILNQEALEERADELQAIGFNGISLVLVSLQPDPNPTEAILEVHFHNNNRVHDIFQAFDSGAKLARELFPISGGLRLPAGPLADQVQVVAIAEDANDKVLHLTVRPIGDYSTYSLNVVFQDIDPFFSEIDFKFRPGCFNLCAPDWDAPPAPRTDPAIDYLAKDYDSFRHTMITWMMDKVPGWQATSEADLDQTLLELFSVAADELSDYQDRVMNEAYLGTARERVSLARHARLMDYHIHQGNQASTWLALEVNTSMTLPLAPSSRLQVGTGEDIEDPACVVFIHRESRTFDPLLNRISFYTWDDAVPALEAGSTQADLIIDDGAKSKAEDVRDWMHSGQVTHLLIQEHLNPLTGEARGRDPTKRQLLQLLPGVLGAEVVEDPVRGKWLVRVNWEEKDQLRSAYCFTVECDSGPVHDVSLFHANLIQVFHGRPVEVSFYEPGSTLAGVDDLYYQRSEVGEALCKLDTLPLAYKDTLPGGDVKPESTLEVEVTHDGGAPEAWDEVISLVHSDDSAEGGDHFVVETDELSRSWLRFGDGINGRKLPEDSVVHAFYQVGYGLDGNVGADTLTAFDEAAFPEIDSCWNPFDVINGRAPEPPQEIIRRAPEAYRYRQLRAVALHDYIERAEELPEVAKASARYMWTGSWRTVRITVDPVGTTTWSEDLEEKLSRHLEAVRLIGEDLELRPPRYVPLDIVVTLCVQQDTWPQDVRSILEQEFSDGYTPDGRMGYFHPDRWTFGQALHVSQIVGRAQAVEGVDHILEISLKRWHAATPGTADVLEVQPNEIVQVLNDPDHKERGMISFDLRGGRQ